VDKRIFIASDRTLRRCQIMQNSVMTGLHYSSCRWIESPTSDIWETVSVLGEVSKININVPARTRLGVAVYSLYLSMADFILQGQDTESTLKLIHQSSYGKYHIAACFKGN